VCNQKERKETIMKNNTRPTQTFIGVMLLAAITSSVYAGLGSHALHSYYALALAALAAATSRMKVKLPGVEGNMSVNLPFLLMAVISLSAVEAVLIACISTAVQCWPQESKKFRPEQMLFNVSMMAFATSTANLIWNAGWLSHASWTSPALVLASTTAAFFLGQTVPVAAIIKLTQGETMRRVWMSIVQLSFPYYVVSAGVTSMLSLVSHRFGWQAAIVVFPVMYGIHHSYRLYFGRVSEALRTPLARTASAGA
jgi:MASE9 protein